jgi:hypothetical protein
MAKQITVTINEADLENFLSDCSDVDEACEQYRAEYERLLNAGDDSIEYTVELAETSGNTEYAFDGFDADFDEEAETRWIEDIANQLVNDWAWLTVPGKDSE